MLDALGQMHTTLIAVQPGEAATLIYPLLKPLNRVESQVTSSLRSILQRLQAGNLSGASPLDVAGRRQPLMHVPETFKLFDDCYAECLREMVRANRRALSGLASDGRTGVPSLSNNEVLTFNALVFSIKRLTHHMQSCDARLEEMLANQRPIDLRGVSFV